MSLLTVQQIVRAGAAKASLVPADVDGDRFFNDGKTYVEVNNGGGSPITITVVSPRDSNLGMDQDETVVVPDGDTHLFGPFEVSAYNADGSNEVSLEYSAITSVIVGAFSVNNKAN